MHITRSARLIGIFFIFSCLYLIIFINLYILQIKQTGFFTNLAQQQYHVTLTQMPPRAEIYDRFGKALALNKESLAAFIIPTNLEEPEKVTQFLKKHFNQAYQRFIQQQTHNFLYIKRRLNAEQQALIETANLKDIKLLKEPSRYYPVESMGPIIGLTDIDNQGTIGIELQYNNILAGKPSTYTLDKDARSGHFYFKRETKIQGALGTPITLTIDSVLQFLCYEELKEIMPLLGAQEVSTLIMNPDNGEILALATYPDFDANNTHELDMDKTRNKVIADAYELGSVVKIFLALAALEEKVVTPDELIDCQNSTHATLNGVSFSTWKAHGIIPFSQVIQGSNNIGVAKVAQRLGTKLYDHYKKLGFGEKIGIGSGESKGLITPPHHWSKASIISLSFGYEMSASLLQLAQALTVIATNGYLVKPTLIKQEHSIAYNRANKPLYSPAALESIREILHKNMVVGSGAKGNIPGYTIMGKTGTARLLTNGKYDTRRHIFTFAGIIEKGSYKRIVITFIKETTQKNAYASTTAVPLFENIAQKMLIHDKVI